MIFFSNFRSPKKPRNLDNKTGKIKELISAFYTFVLTWIFFLTHTNQIRISNLKIKPKSSNIIMRVILRIRFDLYLSLIDRSTIGESYKALNITIRSSISILHKDDSITKRLRRKNVSFLTNRAGLALGFFFSFSKSFFFLHSFSPFFFSL